jgi:glycosyltransferase involved in cell wall biosynthesis
VIAQCLDHLLGWIDGLYILDLGSTDNTWDIVQDYAARDKRIVPFEHRPIPLQRQPAQLHLPPLSRAF